MEVLIITRHYLDQSLGGPNCSKAFIKAVSSIYSNCTLIYPEHNGYDTDLSFAHSNIRAIKCYDTRSKITKLIDMYRGHLHRFGKFVQDFLNCNDFDIIFIDHSLTASSGVLASAIKSGSKIVTLHHNVEKDYIKDNQQSILFRIPYNHHALKAEHDAILKSDLNLTLTKSDNDKFINRYRERAGSFDVLGTFEYKEHNITEPNDIRKEDVFIISGALSAQQTESAIIGFLDDYMPVLNKICPDNKLIITGRNPSGKIISACKRFNNITVIPNPKDILHVINKGKYYICPLHTGSGLKLRIMDGLRLGLPVLAHEISCRGYESIIKDGFMFRYSDLNSFEEGLRELMSANVCRKQVTESFSSHFSYKSGEQKLASILKRHRLL